MNLPACHQDSPKHSAWVARVQELENEGLDTSDAQGIADMELDENLFTPKTQTKNKINKYNNMKEISAALVKAQRAFGPALKSSTNPHFRSRYADLSACVEAVIEGLNNNGIALIQETHDAEGGVAVETVFIHESGERLSAGRFSVPATKQDAQGYGSALTYARRYSLMAACGIAPEDDDGNAASAPRNAVKPKEAPKPQGSQAKPKEAINNANGDDIQLDTNWWTPEVAATLANGGEVNAFLVKRGKITEGQTWRDVKDETYRKNINTGLDRFVAAVEKGVK